MPKRNREDDANNDDDDVNSTGEETQGEREDSRSFKCQFCQARYNYKESLDLHVRRVHRDKLTHNCNLCNFQTNHINDYVLHCRRYHPEIRPVAQWSEKRRRRYNEANPTIYNRPDTDDDDDDVGANTSNNYEVTLNNGNNSTSSAGRISHAKETSSFKRAAVEQRFRYSGPPDMFRAMNDFRFKIYQLLKDYAAKHRSLKFQFTLVPHFVRLNNQGIIVDHAEPHLNTHMTRILDVESEFNDAYDDGVERIWKQFEEWLCNGSGWVLKSISYLIVNIFQYRPFAAASWIATPEAIRFKKAVVNVKNTDDKACFKYAFLASQHANDYNNSNKNKNRPSSYKKYEDPKYGYDFTGLTYPVQVSDIDHFEKKNRRFAINVFQIGENGKRVTPLRISKHVLRREKDVNLLLIMGKKKSHYVWISNPDNLLKTSYKHHGKTKVCLNCCQTFYKEERYLEHLSQCLTNAPAKVTYPYHKKVKFRNFGFQAVQEFTAYADFETRNVPCSSMDDDMNVDKDEDDISTSEEEENTDEISTSLVESSDEDFKAPPPPKKAKTQVTGIHEVSGYTIQVVTPKFQYLFPPIIYRKLKPSDAEAGDKFIEDVKMLSDKVQEIYSKEYNKPMNDLTEKQKRKHSDADTCYLCGGRFSCQASWSDWEWLTKTGQLTDDIEDETKMYVESDALRGPKVRDHDHWTGCYRGPCHALCNIQFYERKKLNMFFHGGEHFDFHLLIQHLHPYINTNPKAFSKPRVIGKSMERFINIDMESVLIKDSSNFLSTSLESLVRNLKAKGEKEGSLKKVFKHSYAFFKAKYRHLPDSAFELLTRKGQFCYEYITSNAVFEEPTLPSKENFYSSLRMQHISDEDYEFAQEVFRTFGCKNLGEYHDLYCGTDVMLLADCFEDFRKLCLSIYQLDPVHFSTAPGLSWQACLKYTGIQLDILTDISMNLFIDAAMMGGFSGVITQHSTANNPHLENWDPQLPLKFIALFDCNNQYGAAMQELLPYGSFEWVEREDLPLFTEDLIKYMDHDSDIGYFIECDLHVPESLHDEHFEYPYAMESTEIRENMLSNYQKKLSRELNLRVGGKKLCTTLSDKKKYIVHSKNLKQYIEGGLKLTKVHRVLSFKQSRWLEKYVKLNTNLRVTSTDPCMRDFAKLMNNSCFGKFCEDTKKHRNIKLIFSKSQFEREARKPTFNRGIPYAENFAVVEMKKRTVSLSKPRYVGCAILALSKIYMYNFHYKFIKKYWPKNKSLLLFTDTDSLCYEFTTEGDFYSELNKANKTADIIDFSNYEKKAGGFYDDKHYLQPGYFKDEMGGKPIAAFTGLRAKMYCIKMGDGSCKKTSKGLTKAYKQLLSYEADYLHVLKKKTFQYATMGRLINKKHRIYTVNSTKIGLSPLNDKRYIESNGLSLPFGHYSIKY